MQHHCSLTLALATRRQLDPRVHPAMYVKSAAILFTLVASWLGAFFLFPSSFAVRLAASLAIPPG